LILQRVNPFKNHSKELIMRREILSADIEMPEVLSGRVVDTIDGREIYASQTAMRQVVMDFDDVLSHSNQAGNDIRTLAFPAITGSLFNALHNLGISITIASKRASKDSILACLNENAIGGLATVYGSEDGMSTIGILQSISAENDV